MNSRSGKTSMGNIYFKFFIFYTILWIIIVNLGGLYPQEGELKPHPDGWRVVTTAERIKNFMIMTLMFYGGGFFVVWAAMRIQHTISDGLLGGDPSYRTWREQGGDPFVDAMGFPLNNQSLDERASTGPLNCFQCRTRLVNIVSAGELLPECPNCGCAWYQGQWYGPKTN